MPPSFAVDSYSEELLKLQKTTLFTIFLCGPSLTDQTPAGVLRRQLQIDLEKDGYDVVLGEDEGLNNSRFKAGLNAQDQELEFIASSCNAVIIVAASPGSLCELGLFSWHFIHPRGRIKKKHDTLFAVILDKKHEGQTSYISEGPIASLYTYGTIFYSDFSAFDSSELLKQLRHRRSLHTVRRKAARK